MAGGRLGCGDYTVVVTDRCGSPRLCELINVSDIQWSRRLDDVSEATFLVPLSSGKDESCCDCLGDIFPLCHEIQVFRNSELVWCGPVWNVTYRPEEVEIYARDVLAWTELRVPAGVIDFSVNTAEMTVIANNVLDVAFAEDDPCVLEFVQTFPTTLTDIGIRFEAFDKTSREQLDDLAGIGLDFTVIGRSVVLGGEDLPVRAVGVLTDDNIYGDIELTKRADFIGNRFYVRYEGDDDAATCTANGGGVPPCPAVREGDQQCYGLVERLRNDGVPFNVETANQTAQAYVDAGGEPPYIFEFPSGGVGQDSPFEINDLVPGVRVDVSVRSLCVPVYQSFKLQGLDVTVTAGEEIVSPIMSPINLITGDI